MSKTIKATETTTLEFEVTPPLYLPFYNKWSKNVYWQYRAFDMDPFTLRALSTSGSPVVIAGNKFFGFMNTTGGRFSYNGAATLTVTMPAGQELYYDECCDPYTCWQEYNAKIISTQPKSNTYDFWDNLEYCTWVEQKKAATLAAGETRDMLNEKFVYDYLDRVNKLGLPRGKFTIDDGWATNRDANGQAVLGDWEVDPEKFPNMPQMVKDIVSEGHIPGIWMAPTLLTPNSKVGTKHPEWVGGSFNSNAENEFVKSFHFLKPMEEVREYYHDITAPFIDMGFKKLKIDMTYGNKDEMAFLLKLFYKEVKKQSDEVEVEIHVPDIFVSCYADSVRINDVLFDKNQDWRGVTYEHYKICKFSSPHKLTNVDHIGTNTDLPSAADFVAHWEILKKFEGYKVISLLPDHFDKSICDPFVDEINALFGNSFKPVSK